MMFLAIVYLIMLENKTLIGIIDTPTLYTFLIKKGN